MHSNNFSRDRSRLSLQLRRNASRRSSSRIPLRALRRRGKLAPRFNPLFPPNPSASSSTPIPASTIAMAIFPRPALIPETES